MHVHLIGRALEDKGASEQATRDYPGTAAIIGAEHDHGHEFTLMVEWGGMTPMEAIVAGTHNVSLLLGWDARVGTLAAGKLADIVAVPGNPLTDARARERTVFVMKNGVV